MVRRHFLVNNSFAVHSNSPFRPLLDGPVAFEDHVFDMAEARLLRGGKPVPLMGRPLQLLAVLAANPGRLLTKDEVLDRVWGHQHVTDSALKVAINALRTALGDDAREPRFIETVPRHGYRFLPRVVKLGAPDAGAAAPGPLPVAVAPAVPPTAPTTAPALGNLPPSIDVLVGRHAELQRLLLLQREHRLLTMTGLGGVGKTRLALALAAQDPPPAGVWLLRLDEVDDPARVVPMLAALLRLGSTAAANAPSLGRALSGQSLRLVLDNAEHLVAEVAKVVAELRTAAPDVQLLVTSQVPLRVEGEQTVAISPLALPADLGDAAPNPAHYAAAQLLCTRVRQSLPGWEPAAQEHEAVAAICRALDGVPLALELAAARVPLLGLAGVRDRLDERFSLLTRHARPTVARHRTLTAALDWTFGLLGPAPRRALLRLSVFAGSFSSAAAEEVLGSEPGEATALDQIDALLDSSLLVAEQMPGQPTRLRLFDSVRRYAQQALQDAGQVREARARHLRCMLGLAERAEEAEFMQPQEHWLRIVRPDLDNLRAALQFGLHEAADDAGLRDLGQQLLAASACIWYRSGVRLDLLAWLTQALALPAVERTHDLLLLAHARVVTYTSMGDLEAARRAAELAVERWAARADARRAFQSLYALRSLLIRLRPGQDPTPELRAMRSLVQPHWCEMSLRLLHALEAMACRDRGDMAGFCSGFERMAVALRAEGAAADVWFCDMGQAQALVLMGRIEEAAPLLARAVAEIRAAGALREQVQVVAMNATLQLWTGSPGHLETALEAVQVLQAEAMVWWMADALAWAPWHQGRWEDAARLQAWADGLVQQRGEKRGHVFDRMRRDLGEKMARVGLDPGHLQGFELTQPVALALALGKPATGHPG